MQNNTLVQNHYNKKYFDWQKTSSEFLSKIDLKKFSKYINSSDNVIEFGCGGGYLLSQIDCKNKIGIEINPNAIKIAKSKQLKVVKLISEIEDTWADIIISNHALEHTHNPLQILKSLHSKLKSGGIIVFVVPHELKWEYEKNDINQHLYTWSPMSLGNLFKTAGYNVKGVDTIKCQVPPIFYIKLHKILGEFLFNILCQFYSRTSWIIYKLWLYQIRIVCTK